MPNSYHVVIIGGGPSGSTVGSMLKVHFPHLSVLILERETFPRDHVGESLLPISGLILREMGAWDKVEAGDFPIKVGTTFKWGANDDLWDFNLVDSAQVAEDAPRPGKFEGWRTSSSFLVERSKFDRILLDHAAELGCEVRKGCGVEEVLKESDRVTGLVLSDGSTATGLCVVDCSGNSGTLRKALGVEIEEPPALRNIAIWDHWDNADWAVRIGVDGTRAQILSLGYGWIWFIPISRTRTSIGLVCPADYYRKLGKRPEQIYRQAVTSEPRISALIANATPIGAVKESEGRAFIASRMVGENWFLVGESAGFADPILSAGVTMAMVCARECAYTIGELDRGELDSEWIRQAFDQRQKDRISQCIRLANFWYAGNGLLTDLAEYTSEVANEAGFKMNAKSAWQWLGSEGFISLETAGPGLAGHTIEQLKNIQAMLFNEETDWAITKYNVFDLNIDGVVLDKAPLYDSGRIKAGRVMRKDGMELPVWGGFRVALEILHRELKLEGIIRALRQVSAQAGPVVALNALEAIEVMLKDGWLIGSYDETKLLLQSHDIPRTPHIDWNKDNVDPKVKLSPVIAT